MPQPALVDSVPHLVDAIVASLERSEPETGAAVAVAERHASERAGAAGYDLRQLLAEYEILRRVLFDHLDAAAALSRRQRDVVLDLLHAAKTVAAERYMRGVLERETRSAEELRRTEERLHLALEAAHTGVFEIDVRTGGLTWSSRLRELWGWRPEDEPTLDTFFARVHPDDRDRVERAIRSAIEQGTTCDVDHRVVRADGIHWIAVKGRPTLDERGEVVRLTGAAVEITDRVLAEQDLRRSVELFTYASRATNDLIWSWDLTTDRLTWNDAVWSPLGYPSSMGETEGRWWYAQIHPEDRERVRASIQATVARAREGAGQERWIGEYRFRRADGRYVDVVDRGFVVLDAAGRPARMIGAMQDVTEQKRTVDALKMSELSFRTLAESMPQIVWTARPDGYVDWYNQWWYDYTGAPRGLDWDQPGAPLHPDDLEPTRRRWREAIESGERYEMEYRFRRASDGQYRWHIGRAVPLKDEAGRTVRWIGTNTDVHDQRMLLEQLRATQERLALALRASGIGILDHDLRTGVVEWTPEAAQLFGFPEDRLRLPFDEVFARFHPEDRGWVQGVRLDAARHGREYHTEFRVCRPDGSMRWIHALGRGMRDERGPARLLGMNMDVTERKEQEQALAQALQSVQDFKLALDASSIVATTDPRGVITYVNDKFCEISKYSREELIGKTHAVVSSGHHPREFFKDLWRTIGSGRVWRGEIKNRAKDGSYYWVDTVIVPFMKHGRPVQYIAVRNDISRRMQALEDLREERERRERFVSMLTHDLRNPLTTAKTSLQLIARKADDPDRVIARSSKAIDALDRADRMIQDLLDVSRIEAGQRLALELAPCDLVALAREVCDDMSVAYGADLRTDAPDALVGSWSCGELRRAVENLVSNACKYGDLMRPIRLKIARQGDAALLSVHNFGPPIPPSDQRAIFESFQRSERTKSSKGWGIGLSLVKGVVDAHHGEVTLRSDESHGTTFTIRLPLEPPEPQRSSVP